MQQPDDKFFKSEVRGLIRDYSHVLERVCNEETQKLNGDTKLGSTEFEIVKEAIYNAGVKEGMRRLVAKLHDHAKTDL